MSGKRIYIALCAIAIGKAIVTPPNQLPADVSDAKIKSLLANGSIEEVEAAEPGAEEVERLELERRATELGIARANEITSAGLIVLIANAEASQAATATVSGDGSGEALPDASNSIKDAPGIDVDGAQPVVGFAVFDGGQLAGVQTTDGALKPLTDLTVEVLKKMASDAGIKGFANMNKAKLVEALTVA